MKLRGAIIGCGMIAEYHLRSWLRIPEVEIVALVDTDQEKARQRRDTFIPSAVVYHTMTELLNAWGLDFVDILTPPPYHREQCLEAAAKQVHIICQKPLCDRLEKAESLVHELSEYSKLFCVHENHPWRPWFRDVAELHREGFFGEGVELAILHHESMEPTEKFKTGAEQGIMLDYGIHLVAMARALFGDVVSVDARFARINPRVRGESQAIVKLEFAKSMANMDIAWLDHGRFKGGFVLRGSQGQAYLEGTMTRGGFSRLRVMKNDSVVRDEVRNPSDDYRESFYLFQKAFVCAVLQNGLVPEPASHNLKTLQSTFAVYDSAAFEKSI